ncbi:Gustatory receptor 93, partial [Frankliniella occidentalis]
VMGNTVTYMMMLVQYPILTPGKAAAVLNQSESVASEQSKGTSAT